MNASFPFLQPQQPQPQPLAQPQPQLRLMTRKELTDPFGSDDEEDQPLPHRNGVSDSEPGKDIDSYTFIPTVTS